MREEARRRRRRKGEEVSLTHCCAATVVQLVGEFELVELDIDDYWRECRREGEQGGEEESCCTHE